MTKIKIPFLRLNNFYRIHKKHLDKAYNEFIESGRYVLGTKLSQFEDKYAQYCIAKRCVGVASGLDALHLALRAVDCGQGNEVIVASNTYIATWLAVTQTGATILPVEPDEKTYNIHPQLIEKKITRKTRVILATNLYGQACDYNAIQSIASKHNLIFITDNAQAQGAKYNGIRVGGLADIECHSFYPSKNLGAFGEAGAITTNDSKIADKIMMMRNYGSVTRYKNDILGYNSRLDELQAAFLQIKLQALDSENWQRGKIANFYYSKLNKAPNLKVPFVDPQNLHVWHLYVVRHVKRDLLQKKT